MTNDFDTMSLADYLAAGGRLTSPGNVPPRYRAELLKLMATFVDSNLAGAAGFAEQINGGPGIKAREASARIVAEKLANARQVLTLMGEFGADTARYVDQHPWHTRLARDADIGASRVAGDMRLAVLNYPLEGWSDAVVMNFLMGHAVWVQLGEFVGVSYQPLAEAFRAIRKIEATHVALAEDGLSQLVSNGSKLQKNIDYWLPRVATSFGPASSERFTQLQAMGLRHQTNEMLREIWLERIRPILTKLDLKA